MALSKKEQAWVSIGIIAIIGLAILIIKIKIAIIHSCQNMFWISLIMVPAFFLLFAGFLIWGLLKEDGYIYLESEFFDKSMILIFAFGFFILCLVSFISVPYFYEQGYSDQALQNLAEYENQLQGLQQIQSIFTGEIVWNIENQVIEETINNMCNDPNYPCKQTKQSFQIYKDIKGAKDDADKIANFWGFAQKVVNR